MATQAELEHSSRQLDLQQEVHDLLTKHSVENWDGEGALPLSPKTVAIAQELASLFPDGLEKPEVSASPQGDVDFDWATSENEFLTVGVCPPDEIVFAALFKEARLSGSEPWQGKLPRFVQSCFERISESSQ